jgi:hypothetical protein
MFSLRAIEADATLLFFGNVWHSVLEVDAVQRG